MTATTHALTHSLTVTAIVLAVCLIIACAALIILFVHIALRTIKQNYISKYEYEWPDAWGDPERMKNIDQHIPRIDCDGRPVFNTIRFSAFTDPDFQLEKCHDFTTYGFLYGPHNLPIGFATIPDQTRYKTWLIQNKNRLGIEIIK